MLLEKCVEFCLSPFLNLVFKGWMFVIARRAVQKTINFLSIY